MKRIEKRKNPKNEKEETSVPNGLTLALRGQMKGVKINTRKYPIIAIVKEEPVIGVVSLSFSKKKTKRE